MGKHILSTELLLYSLFQIQKINRKLITLMEIEKTIDTLNTAFEKLLDDLFQDTSWDVSSDISVLEMMLAQDGLTEDGLKKKR